MAKQPEAYIDFEVYEDAKNFIGISQATLPDITFLTQTITGAGISGNVEAVLTGMVEAMSLTLNFRSATDAAVSLMAPKRHNIDLRVAEQNWDTSKIAKTISADKYVMVVIPTTTKPGSVAPASAADSSGEYSVYYYANDMRMAEGLKILKVNGVEPEPESIASEAYPFIASYYTTIPADTPENAPARILYNRLQSEEGHALIGTMGYVPSSAEGWK